jgi:hypothetical protein
MFRSLPRMVGFLLLAGCLFAMLADSATGQFIGINGNHQTDKKFPPIFDKGFRPGFGTAPPITSSAPKLTLGNNILGSNQNNQGGIGGGLGGNSGIGGGIGGIGGGIGGLGGIGGGLGGNAGIKGIGFSGGYGI